MPGKELKKELKEESVVVIHNGSTKEILTPARSMDEAKKLAAKAMGIKGFKTIISEKTYGDEFVFVAEYVTKNKKGDSFFQVSKFKIPK